MSNITLNVPDEVLDRARVIAAKRKTTVNAMVRDFLNQVAESDSAVGRRRSKLLELAEKSKAELGPITWKRGNLHDR